MRTRSRLIDLASLKVAIHKRILLSPGTEIVKVRKNNPGNNGKYSLPQKNHTPSHPRRTPDIPN